MNNEMTDWSELYDHEFTCLNSGLDPAQASRSMAELTKSSAYSSATEMIIKSSERLAFALKSHAPLIVKEFNWKGYKQRNKDLAHLLPSQLVDHFLEHGIRECRHWDPSASLLDRRFAWAIHSSSDLHLKTKIQVVTHVYHFKVLCSLLPLLKILARAGAKINLLVANERISESVLNEIVSSLNSGSTEHQWFRVQNQGEDWCSFHEAYRLKLFETEGITYKLQTKLASNLGPDGGAAWIEEALGPLCGNQAAVLKTLQSLISDSHLIAASSAVGRTGFGQNPDLVKVFIERACKHAWSHYLEVPFASGSMFAAKNSLISSFYSKIGEVDYSKRYENGSDFCGRYPGHALERVFFYYALDQSIDSQAIISTCWL